MRELDRSLIIAIERHRDGRLAEAEAIYREVLAANPQHSDALHLLGVLAHQVGRDDVAIGLIRQAIAHSPGIADFHNNLGEAFRAAARREAARSCYRNALILQPDHANAITNYAIAPDRGDSLQMAVALQRRLCRLTPQSAQALWQLAALLRDVGDPGHAYRLLCRALTLEPGYGDALNNFGLLLRDTGQFVTATAILRRAHHLNPSAIDPLINLGNVLHDLKRPHDAATCVRFALRLAPSRVESWFNLANILADTATPELAIPGYRRAWLLRRTADPLINLGIIWRTLDHSGRAVACLRRAQEIDPGHPAAVTNLATALHDQGDFAGALVQHGRALRLDGTLAEIRNNHAQTRLMIGDYAAGWPDYEGRIALVFGDELSKPRWNGEYLAGKTVLVQAEQGLGDTLQFLRYVPLVTARGGRVVLAIQRQLVSLLKDFSCVEELVAIGDPLPSFDCWIPLLSLPLVFATTLETIPGPKAYLRADPKQVARWRQRLGDGIRVGLVWAGSPGVGTLRQRTCSLDALAPLLDVPGIRWFSLQKGPHAADLAQRGWQDRVTDLDPLIDNFADTAAIIANLDLVVSVDTSVAHLTGALGQPCWVLLKFAPDWRWMLNRTDSPWYPSLRLFRQPRPGDWAAVAADVGDALRQCAKG
ncbi:MAG: tetratricopeptide repeat protein [Acidobacteriaceae bacterium]|nr:tetratricopeptide repeat protein [Acidobacteriaceae bacterium]